MKMEYYLNYINSVCKGLLKSSYFEGNLEIDGDLFFKKVIALMSSLRENSHKIYFFGNGASAAFANHMALDFSKNGKILSRSLSDSAMLTALSNDYTYEQAMVEYLKIENLFEIIKKELKILSSFFI